MAGVWLVVLASSSTLYGKVPRLILKKRSRLTQQVVSFSRKHFLFGALLCNRSSAEREGLSTHTCVCVCVCVCAFLPFILEVKFVGCTSRGHTGGRSHRISHPPSFCGACLYFSRARRIQPFLSLVDREVEFSILKN